MADHTGSTCHGQRQMERKRPEPSHHVLLLLLLCFLDLGLIYTQSYYFLNDSPVLRFSFFVFADTTAIRSGRRNSETLESKHGLERPNQYW